MRDGKLHVTEVGRVRRVLDLLKACAKQKDLRNAIRLHADILKQGLLETCRCISSSLVNMYTKCGALAKAWDVFDELPVRDVYSWSALIAGYTQHGQGDEALKFLDHMLREGPLPNAVIFLCALKACGSVGACEKGERIHDEIVRLGLLRDNIELGTALVNMYAKCSALAKAEKLVEELSVHDAVMWSALITGYLERGNGEKALHCFARMQQEGHIPDAVTFITVLKACAAIRAAGRAKLIHDEIIRLDLLENNILLGNALVDTHAKCGALTKAQEVLDELCVRDVVSWNALIAGYIQHGQGKEALKLFDMMQHEGHSPDAITYSCVLKACGDVGAADKGREIHDQIYGQGLLSCDVALGHTLIEMYVKCGLGAKVEQVLDELCIRNVVLWNGLMARYIEQGKDDEALKCFNQMQHEGQSPDAVTFICVLKACGRTGVIGKGRQIHDEIVRLNLLQNNSAVGSSCMDGNTGTVLGTALVDMYAKCGDISQARKVLDELCPRDGVTWNALIAGYAQLDQGEEALKCFGMMQQEGHSPNAATFVCILKACGSIGAADKGKQMHHEIVKLELLKNNSVLGNTMVGMYAKCGALATAWQLVEELDFRNVITWNALLAGYAQQGQCISVLNCLQQIQCEGVSPDESTFAIVLRTCSHSGLVDKGQIHFAGMSTKYDIAPDINHFFSMVDLFGRAGEFVKATEVIETMTICDSLPVWGILLGACHKWGYVKLGRLAFEYAIEF